MGWLRSDSCDGLSCADFYRAFQAREAGSAKALGQPAALSIPDRTWAEDTQETR